jgi:hypothetical protein
MMPRADGEAFGVRGMASRLHWLSLPAVATLSLVACVVSARAAAPSEQGRWLPPDVVATAISADAVVARMRGLTQPGAGSLRAWKLTLQSGDRTLPVDAIVHGADVRFDVSIGAARYAMGRLDGVRWRRTPNNVTRIVRSDVQGDDLDRWPVATFSPRVEHCAAAGTSNNDDVLACRDAYGDARFLYVATSGRIARETMREGSRVSTFLFHYADAARAAVAGWSITGAGGPAEVTILSDLPAPPDAGTRLDAPFEQPPPFVDAFDSAVRISSSMRGGAAYADARVNGHAGRFQIDDGTTQMLLDSEYARHVGIATTLGHGIATTLDFGPMHGRDIAVQTAELGNIDGILGFEAFLGHIVHVDYVRGTVDLIPHAVFTPPPGARMLPMDVSEGLPLLAGKIGDVPVTRIVPDLGSTRVVIPRFFNDSRTGAARVRAVGRRIAEGYLEGPMVFDTSLAESLGIGPFTFNDVPAFIEAPTSADIDIPLDAIVGTSILRSFEWWFDYDAGNVYARPV